jgi:uncharacterized oligopeptide transporter (OPT) family protein
MSSTAKPAPLATTTPRNELTLRGLVLGVVITVVFTAANVYFGLKAGLTFATSIPAAVISMALLRGLKGVTVQENNIVQTVASAAGTLSSVIFVLPGMVIIGWWTGFPYWVSCAICALGGILGVMYSIPRRSRRAAPVWPPWFGGRSFRRPLPASWPRASSAATWCGIFASAVIGAA